VSETARKRYVFHGRVQGVGFRAFCQDAAVARRLQGWVRNRPDGAVELEAEAAPEALSEFRRHVETAHPMARVDRVEESDVSPRRDRAEGFEVTY
jgi:acylphosphatase